MSARTDGSVGDLAAPEPGSTGQDDGIPVVVADSQVPLRTVKALTTLDGLRAVAALGVVYFHMAPALEQQGVTLPAAALGEQGVQMFFVLSGYLITTSIIAPTTFSPGGYARKRAFRILPVYYVSLVVVLLLVNSQYLLTREGVADIVSHLFLVQIFFRDFRVSINGVLWTLSIEWLFYWLMLALAGPLRHRLGRWAVGLGMLALGVTWRLWAWSEFQGQPGELVFYYKQLTGTADLFACGILVALALHHERVRQVVGGAVLRWVGLVVSAVVALGALAYLRDFDTTVEYTSSGRVYVGWPLAFAVGCAGLVLFIQSHEHWMRPILRWSGLAFVGVVSYSLYLFHTLVIGSIGRAWRATDPNVPAWTMIPLILGAAIVLSTITYYTVERTGMRFPRELRAQPRDRPLLERLRGAVRATFG